MTTVQPTPGPDAAARDESPSTTDGDVQAPASTPAPAPQEITITRADVACVGPILLLGVWTWASLPLNPLLLGTHPLLLSFLRGNISAMVTTGSFASVGRLPLILALLAPIPILFIDHPFVYWAGRRYGRRVVEYYTRDNPRMARRVARAERIFARWGPWAIFTSYFTPIPTEACLVAAGETRMAIPLWVAADLGGILCWVGMVVSLGWFLGQRGVDVASAISHYGLIASLVLLALMIAFGVRRGMRMARQSS